MDLKLLQSRDNISHLQKFAAVWKQLLKITSLKVVKLLIWLSITTIPVNRINGSHLIIHYDDGYLESELNFEADSVLNAEFKVTHDSTNFYLKFNKTVE